MTTEQMINYWLKSAEEDVITAESLFAAKRFLPCLFYCHLFVEKIIKAIIVKKTEEPAPYGHKLTRLANYTSFDFSDRQKKLLSDLTAFNIKARYEDYKFAIYKRATKVYTKKLLKRSEGPLFMVKRKKIDGSVIAIVKKYINYLKSKGIRVEKAVLFGSYTRGNWRDDSDIDVCLVSDRFGRDEIGELQRLLYESEKIDDRIEPIPVSKKDFETNATPFIKEIKKHGRSLSV